MMLRNMGFRIFYFSCMCLIAAGSYAAQIGDDYIPITSNQINLPSDFFNFTKASISSKINGGEELDPLKLEKISKDISYFRKEYTEGGDFYLKNELTDYVKSVANELLAGMPNQKNNFTVHLGRSMEVNAFCMADGTVIINLGLIASLDNESQLAFILAHELSHYIKKHSVKDLQRTEQVLTYDNTNQGSNQSVFRRLQFSRDSEFDADGFAINLLANTHFDPNEGVTALEKLRVKDTLIDGDPTQLMLTKYFKTEYCDFDTAWISEEAIEKMQNRENADRSSLVVQDFGDLLSTHPEIEKHQYAFGPNVSHAYYGSVDFSENMMKLTVSYTIETALFGGKEIDKCTAVYSKL